MIHQIAADWRQAPLAPADAALCAFAEKLTRHPSLMSADDIEAPRAAGFDARAIHDATQIAGYFNYINRVADALHVEQETFVRTWEPPPDGET